ncbi:MAG: [NiFe]-hydrogenase assembly chaperone HybE [Dechloromonas sp.]|nr:[NiFe]-hydrogenase assembly chaperone HybE [Dechloromonas sp.]
MTSPIRQPAIAPPPIRPAMPRADDPSAWLEAHYRAVYAERMADLPFVNAALQVEAVGFDRLRGDWLGVMVTPWFINLFLLNGGGELWGDIPAGQRRYLELPCGTLQFLADDDPVLGPYQYCPLIAPVGEVADMTVARQAAVDALATVFSRPAPPPAEAPEQAPPKNVTRRGFLRSLTGRR